MNMLECANAELNGAAAGKFVTARSNLCHPTETGDSVCVSKDETWMDTMHTVLKTPIGCGESAYLYKGYTMLGANMFNDKSIEKIYIDTGSLRTAGRARATNEFLLDKCDYHIDPDTWLLLGDNKAFDLRDVSGFLITEGQLIFTDEEKTVTCNVAEYIERLNAKRKALKFYAEFCVNTVLDLGGDLSEVSDVVADDSAFLHSAATTFHAPYEHQSNKDFDALIESMTFIPNIVASAIALVDGTVESEMQTKSRPLKGKMIWGVKTHIMNLALSALGYPAKFERK